MKKIVCKLREGTSDGGGDYHYFEVILSNHPAYINGLRLSDSHIRTAVNEGYHIEIYP